MQKISRLRREMCCAAQTALPQCVAQPPTPLPPEDTVRNPKRPHLNPGADILVFQPPMGRSSVLKDAPILFKAAHVSGPLIPLKEEFA